MRKKAKRRLGKLSQELTSVRTEINEGLKTAYKKGSTENCKRVGSDEDKLHYCTANFPDNPTNLQECTTSQDFCDFCCHNEFGEIYVQERENCLSELCKKEKLTQPNAAGRWIWEKKLEINAIKANNDQKNAVSNNMGQ